MSTAGVGYGFEHKVQAYYLLKLIVGVPISGRLGPVVRLQFQGAYEGISTDDLIRTHINGDRTARVFMQCKMTVHARESDPGFSSALRAAWSDFSAALAYPDHPFQVGTDHFELAYDAGCASDRLSTVKRLIQLAKNSNNASDFSRKCHSDKHREMLKTIHTIVSPGDNVDDPAQALWTFLKSLAVSPLGFDEDRSVDLDTVFDLIATRTGDSLSASQIWKSLVATAADLNGRNATVDASNLEDLVDRSVLEPLKYGVRQIDITPPLPTFPWGAPLWAVQAIKGYVARGNCWKSIPADELLLYLRSLRTSKWLCCELAISSNFDVIIREIAYNLDALYGSYDDKAALATFVMLNLTDAQAQCELVQWAARHTALLYCLSTSEVELTLRKLYVHYHGDDASGSEWMADMARKQRGRSICEAKYTFRELFPILFAGMFDSNAPEHPNPPIDKFNRMTWAIGDTYPDYRHPTRDSSAWPGMEGVVSFEVLMKAVRSGCVSEVLSNYRLCTSEPTFERLLNAFAELSAHVRNCVTCISANDAYILGEMDKLLSNSVAGGARSYAKNKLTVLPIQANFPLCGCEVIKLPFTNISLDTEFEDTARQEHMALTNYYANDKEYTDSRSLWSMETIYADVILAMTLRTKIFANSKAEAEVANMHGIGVSELKMQAIFHE